ncbi:hypothetical protein Bbelb_137070 [Branchiostoma belcheri]|nr:hypothetical protein Bbelb_137070 [Branchiostoma belcheri]
MLNVGFSNFDKGTRRRLIVTEVVSPRHHPCEDIGCPHYPARDVSISSSEEHVRFPDYGGLPTRAHVSVTCTLHCTRNVAWKSSRDGACVRITCAAPRYLQRDPSILVSSCVRRPDCSCEVWRN